MKIMELDEHRTMTKVNQPHQVKYLSLAMRSILQILSIMNNLNLI